MGSLVSTWGLTVFPSSLIIGYVCSSQVEISHTFMEMLLNLLYFTDFYIIEISTSLFWFFSTIIFSPTRYKIIMNFQDFFFVANCIVRRHQWLGPYELPNPSPKQKISEGARNLIILMDSCNYLYSFQKLVAASFFININCYFPDQRKLGHHTSPFTETKVHFMCFFVQRHLLLKSS